MCADAAVQDLEGHVPLGPLLGVWGDLLHTRLLEQVLPDGQSKVCQAAGHVSLHQDILGLEVAMCYPRFDLIVRTYLGVQVGEASHNGGEEHVHLWCGEGVVGEVVIQGAVLVVLQDHPKLCDWIGNSTLGR